jgi:hypothetical protein
LAHLPTTSVYKLIMHVLEKEKERERERERELSDIPPTPQTFLVD